MSETKKHRWLCPEPIKVSLQIKTPMKQMPYKRNQFGGALHLATTIIAPPTRYHTFGINLKVGNLARSTTNILCLLLYCLLRAQANNARMVVSPCGADRETSMASSYQLGLNTTCTLRFRCEDNNISHV